MSLPPLATGSLSTSYQLRPLLWAALLAVASVVAGASVLAAPRSASAQGAEVTIQKATDGVDADAAPGPQVEAGQPVTWTWTVTASGSTSLFDLVVTDSGGAVPDCDVDGDGIGNGTNIHPGPLEPGQSFTCWAVGGANRTPLDGTYQATGQVTASDFAATATFSDTDPSHHTPVAPAPSPQPSSNTEPPAADPNPPTTQAPPAPEQLASTATPGVTIATLVNGQPASGADEPLVAEGASVIWTYVVTNSGDVPLDDVEVRDRAGRAVDCGNGRAQMTGQLAPGASVSCLVTGSAASQSEGLQVTTATVVAIAIDPSTGSPLDEVAASETAAYVPVQVPGQLAFTGPRDRLIPIGLAAIGLGLGLLGSVQLLRRRPTPVPVPVPVAAARPDAGSDDDQGGPPVR